MTLPTVNLDALEAAHKAFRDPANRGWHLEAAIQSYLVALKAETPVPVATNRPGDHAAIYAEETGVDYATALVHCNMD
jgi:hypothetical protein